MRAGFLRLPCRNRGGQLNELSYAKAAAWLARFFHEVVIIVLGVLLALGLEQLISTYHDRASAAETRANIRSELAENLRDLLRRQRTGECVEHRLGEIADFLDASSRGEKPAQPSWIGAPYAPLAGDTAFKSAQSAGKFFLLPQSEQQEMQSFYIDSDDFNVQSTREWYDWAQLRSLTNGVRLTDNEITRLRQALQDARGADRLIRVDVVDYIGWPRTAASSRTIISCGLNSLRLRACQSPCPMRKRPPNPREGSQAIWTSHERRRRAAVMAMPGF